MRVWLREKSHPPPRDWYTRRANVDDEEAEVQEVVDEDDESEEGWLGLSALVLTVESEDRAVSGRETEGVGIEGGGDDPVGC